MAEAGVPAAVPEGVPGGGVPAAASGQPAVPGQPAVAEAGVPYRILGIDPGLANTGWGVIEVSGQKRRALAYGCVSTAAGDPRPQRLKQLHDCLLGVIERYQPRAMAIESVYFGSNAKSALLTGEARGVAILAAANQGLEIGEYSPTQVKQVIVGAGRASKSQVQYMVKAFLRLDHEPSPDHAADALAIAICHDQLGSHCGG